MQLVTLDPGDGIRCVRRVSPCRSITARHLSRYFARWHGISAYTAVSDQHATFDIKVIAAAAREGHLVLDVILGNTDPPILEHA